MPESAVTPDNPDYVVDNVIAEVPVVIKEAKAGYKTTEFWGVVVTGVLAQLGALPMPEKWQGLVAVLLAVSYAISRGLAKNGQPDVQPVVPEA